jgi:serine/threonine-protein kinase
MLTGTVPFKASTQAAILNKQLQEPPAPPSRLRPEIPRELEAIVLKTLEKDPAKREQSMTAIVRALREATRHLGDDPPADTPARGVATIVVEPARRPAPVVSGPTVQVTRTFTQVSPEPAYDPAFSATVVRHEPPTPDTPAEVHPEPTLRRAGSLRRQLAIGGALAAILLASVGTVVYLVAVPPSPATGVPGAASPGRVAPQASSTASGGLEIVPPRPPEPAAPPEPAPPPPKGSPAPEVKPSPEPKASVVVPKPAPPPRPPAPKARVESQAPVVVAKPAPEASSPAGLRAQLEDRLRRRGLLRGSGSDPNTGVTVEVGPNGVVTLSGIVPDVTQRDEAAGLVRIAGVSEVRLRINVQKSWN